MNIKKILFVGVIGVAGVLNITKALGQEAEAEGMDYVKKLLPEGKVKYEVLYQDMPVELKDLIAKSKKAMQRKVDWYNKYKEEHKGKYPLPYHENMGLTQDEYDRLYKEVPKIKMKVKTVEAMNIVKGDSIKFIGIGEFTIFNAVIFDLKNNKLIIDGQKVPYTGMAEQGEESPLGTWNGHRWKYETGDIDEAIKIADDYMMLEITVGKTKEEGKVLLQFAAINVEGGNTLLNATVTGFVRN